MLNFNNFKEKFYTTTKTFWQFANFLDIFGTRFFVHIFF